MEICKVKNVVIGEGIPKICVPIVANTHDEIIKDFKMIKDEEFDLIELRIDFFDGVSNENRVNQLLTDIQQLRITKPIIFTYRSTSQGGNITLTNQQYYHLVELACKSNTIDLIDVELMSDDKLIEELVELIHRYNIKVIMSNHDFKGTPNLETIMLYFQMMASFGDILKIAVMPQNPKDILTLLEATYLASTKFKQPIVTMAMASLGGISRMVGEVFGSSMTFAMLGKPSAPGQIEVNELKAVLNIIHKNY